MTDGPCTFEAEGIEVIGLVEPVLASSLIEDEELDNLLNSVCDSGSKDCKDEQRRLGTGVKSLDTALSGGLESGRIVEISGEAGTGASEICTTLLVTCLLQYEDSTAAVVDTTGNFDVLKLYTLIVARLSRQPHVLASLRASVGLELGSAEDVAAKVLDRVKIMRVFDFEGVREAVGEIRDELEGRRRRQSAERREDEAKKEETPITDRENLAKNREKPKRTFVADSEDEDDDEEEEMLFESENKPSPVSNVQDLDTTSVPEQAQPKLSGTSRQDSETISNKSTPKTLKFILIDNLTQVLSPLLKNDIIKGPFLSSTLLSSLSRLTISHALHTLLLTPTTTPRAAPSSPTRTTSHAGPERLPHGHSHHTGTPLAQPDREKDVPLPSLSIFSSNKVVPLSAGLSGLVGLYAHVRVLVSRMPRRRLDARFYYEEGVGGDVGGMRKKEKKRRGVEMVGVVEVVADRWGGRTGAWGVFKEGESEKGGEIGDV